MITHSFRGARPGGRRAWRLLAASAVEAGEELVSAGDHRLGLPSVRHAA